jgi:hypothetical protein
LSSGSGHGLSVKVVIVNQNLDDNSIKNEIIENLRTPNDYVIVNYKRGVLNQPGGGHISPHLVNVEIEEVDDYDMWGCLLDSA